MSNKTINYINQILEAIRKDKAKNATYQINQNLDISKMTKKQMLKKGNYIYGVNQDTLKDIYINLIFFIECFQDIEFLHLGKWEDPTSKKIIIEIVKFEFDKDKAINQAKKYNQKAIFDIKNNQDITLNYE